MHLLSAVTVPVLSAVLCLVPRSGGVRVRFSARKRGETGSLVCAGS